MSDSQTLGGCWLPASCFRLSVSGFPSTVARHYGVRIMCRLCSYISPAQKSSAGLLPFKGRGPWLFVTQHGRHKSKSRNADFIIITCKAIPQPSGRRPVKLTKLKNPQSPLVPTAPPSRPAGKRVTGFSVAYGSLRIQFPCHRKRGDKKLQGTL